jgi:hypothetical protein
MFDVHENVSWMSGLRQSLHDMTVRSVILLTWSRIMGTPCERLRKALDQKQIDVTVFICIATMVCSRFGICATVPDPGTSVVVPRNHRQTLSSTLPFEDPSPDEFVAWTNPASFFRKNSQISSHSLSLASNCIC